MTTDEFTIQAILAMTPKVVDSEGRAFKTEIRNMIRTAFLMAEEAEEAGIFDDGY